MSQMYYQQPQPGYMGNYAPQAQSGLMANVNQFYSLFANELNSLVARNYITAPEAHTIGNTINQQDTMHHIRNGLYKAYGDIAMSPQVIQQFIHAKINDAITKLRTQPVMNTGFAPTQVVNNSYAPPQVFTNSYLQQNGGNSGYLPPSNNTGNGVYDVNEMYGHMNTNPHTSPNQVPSNNNNNYSPNPQAVVTGSNSQNNYSNVQNYSRNIQNQNGNQHGNQGGVRLDNIENDYDHKMYKLSNVFEYPEEEFVQVTIREVPPHLRKYSGKTAPVPSMLKDLIVREDASGRKAKYDPFTGEKYPWAIEEDERLANGVSENIHESIMEGGIEESQASLVIKEEVINMGRVEIEMNTFNSDYPLSSVESAVTYATETGYIDNGKDFIHPISYDEIDFCRTSFEEGERVMKEVQEILDTANRDTSPDRDDGIYITKIFNKLKESGSGGLSTYLEQQMVERFDQAAAIEFSQPNGQGGIIRLGATTDVAGIMNLLTNSGLHQDWKSNKVLFTKALNNCMKFSYGKILNSLGKGYLNINDPSDRAIILSDDRSGIVLKNDNKLILGGGRLASTIINNPDLTEEQRTNINEEITRQLQDIFPLLIKRKIFLHNLDLPEIPADYFGSYVWKPSPAVAVLRKLLDKNGVMELVSLKDSSQIKHPITVGVDYNNRVIARRSSK